jgi:hypothetical protein
MSEQKQRPPVWLVWDSILEHWVDNVFEDRSLASRIADDDCDVVEMVPREPGGRAELMSEQKLPPAFGVLRIDSREDGTPDAWWADIANDGEYADELVDEFGTPDAPAHVVELIPREDSERMAAEAVAAERGRCGCAIDVAEDAVKSWGWLHDDKYRAVRELLMAIRAEIREVTE